MTYEEISRQDIIDRRGYRKNIKGDKFSLYISNYPSNASYLKSRLGNSEHTLAELCCSIGITLEYLIPGFKKIIGVDIDEKVLGICKTNLSEAGLIDKVELRQGNVFDDAILKNIKADLVIYDIPFWLPHEQESQGNLLDKNPPLKPLIEKIKTYITPQIVIFSPPELDFQHFSRELGEVEYEKVWIDGKHNRSQIYLGGLIKVLGETQIEF